ncbi:MAG: DNA-directed DNA polymerase I, partial [Nitrosopumilaceae archaeon]
MQVEVQNPDKISSMSPSMLVSATYDSVSRSAMLKFYDPKSEKLILWLDEIDHKPYCYSKLELDELDFLQERDDILKIERVKRHDLIKDENIDISKIIVSDPLAIGGTAGEKSIRNVIETWESDIKYYENYLYDRSLIVGKYYEVVDGKIKPHDLEISDEVKIALKSLLWDKVDSENMVDAKEFKECITDWAELLNQPIPKIKRLSVDIEVEAEIGRIPDPKIAERKVTAVGFKGTDGFDKIFVLRTEDTEEGKNELGENIQVVFYDKDKEKEMIADAFKIIEEFPFVLTYNGDEFDLPYLYNRAERLGIKKEENPLYMMRDSATLKHGVHIDLYRTLSNRSFQIYAFSQSYTDFSLNSVSKALLGKEKIDYGIELSDLNLYQTANYCYNDALITYELTSFNHDLLMNLLVIIARIGRMPIDDIARLGVSQWIRSLLYYEHRQRNALIPKREDLQRRSEGVMSEAVIKDKKYRGGLVVEPKEGIHFDVVVMDFASLYPSIIKVKNLSYETVRCSHEECKKNTIPQTNHWACTKRNGLTSIIIGSLRDLRVNYYKSLSKKETLSEEQRQQYTVVSQALKVILNASYGVMGAEIF